MPPLSGRGGRRFKSCHSDQQNQTLLDIPSNRHRFPPQVPPQLGGTKAGLRQPPLGPTVVMLLCAAHRDVDMGAMRIRSGVLAPLPRLGGRAADPTVRYDVLDARILLAHQPLGNGVSVAAAARIMRDIERADDAVNVVHDGRIVIAGPTRMRGIADRAVVMLRALRPTLVELPAQD